MIEPDANAAEAQPAPPPSPAEPPPPFDPDTSLIDYAKRNDDDTGVERR